MESTKERNTISEGTIWEIDSNHSEVTFRVKHLVISTVIGSFDEFSGVVVSSNENFKDAEIIFVAEVMSINTKNAARDEHLRSEDFFDINNCPFIEFKSKYYNGKKLVGDLTIRDHTKEIELNVTYGGTVSDTHGEIKAGFEIAGTINRKEFGLTWSAVTEAGGVVVSDEVKILCHIQLRKEIGAYP